MKFHIVKRDNCPLWKKCCFYLAAVVLALVLGALLLSGLGVDPVAYYTRMFTMGTIGNKIAYKVWINYLKDFVPLALTSVALSLAFKMRFWNIGGEGQFILGAISAAFVAFKMGGIYPNAVVLLVMCLAAMIVAGVYGLFVAALKVRFGTNETLLTLMLNYIALYILIFISEAKESWNFFLDPNSQRPVFASFAKTVSFPGIPMGEKFTLNVCVVFTFLIGLAIYVYLKYTKQGYEIAVVGESQNTARYVGINVKKVIIRTMLISGAICGMAGMLMVAGTDHSINTNTMGGQGFTAIMISWLGQFNPFIMAAMAGLVTFLETGAAKVADSFFLNSSYADIVSGIVILFLVGCEFFIQYTVKFRHNKKGGNA